jgi:hypothetical protein
MHRLGRHALPSSFKGFAARSVTTSRVCAKFASPEDVPVPSSKEINTRQKLAPWQRVQPKGRGFDKEVEYMQKDDSLISDPIRAEKIAKQKLQSLQDMLEAKG